jgi:hypothetical protein
MNQQTVEALPARAGAAGPGRRLRWPGLALLLTVVLAACSGSLDTPGEALRLLGGNLPEAFVGESYDAAFRPAGGLRPYTFELSAGSLPPGLSLVQGGIQGIPTATGSYVFTITVSDANLSKTFLEHKLVVGEIPPPRLAVELPLTEVRSPVTIRIGLEEARELRGLRTRLRWDDTRFSFVPGSLRQVASGAVLLHEQEGDWLQVDLAWLARTQSGERQLFTFQLAPLDVAVPGLVLDTEFALSGTMAFHFASSAAGTRIPAPEAAAGAEDAGSGADAAAAEGDGTDGDGSDSDGTDAEGTDGGGTAGEGRDADGTGTEEGTP